MVELAHRIDELEIETDFLASLPTALARMHDRFGPIVYRIALRSLRDTVEADDVTQLVFVAAWMGRSTFDPTRARLPAWIIGITRNKVADAHARLARERLWRNTLIVAAEADPRPWLDDVENRLIVTDELKKLGRLPQRIIQLSYFEGLTHAEISETLGVPLGTVKSHIRRSLETIRGNLTVVAHEA